MEILGNPVSIAAADDTDDEIDLSDIGVLRRGSRGEGVKLMQEALGLGADGIFGPGTERSLKAWQLSQGLEADGVAGAKTLGKLLG
jgi:peptidoglycan hydrolase-like protein with peptidoglycan-binding domain